MPRRSPPAYIADSTEKNTNEQSLTAKVALIGRVNVGKSSLFNRLIGRKRALVSPEPGTTRDRQEGLVEWANKRFILIDTGGVEAILSQKNNLGEEEPL